MIKKERIISLTQKLIREKSENPPGKEYKAAMIVKKEMENIGLDVSVYEFEKGRPNIIGILKGDGTSKKSLLLATHTDVVPAGYDWVHDPYSAELIKGKIYGRGASDCKGHVAVCLEVARSIAEDKRRLEGDLIIAATVDEEKGNGKGMKPLLEKGILRPSSAVAVDIGSFDVVVAQKGLIHATIKIKGKEAHGAYPQEGINAIEITAKIITDLKKHKFNYRAHPFFKEPTINIGTIKGGDKVNMVAEHCEFEADIRYLPGMDKDKTLKTIENIIKKHSKEYTITVDSQLDPYEIKSKEKIIGQLKEAFENKGKHAKICGSSGATVICEFKKYDIPAIATGFGIDKCMHAKDEYVVVDDLVKGADILEEFVMLSIGK
ncbi:MAG: ArgE/DapE family deacylase [Candidatus Aenigmarchaeota archaeon]|nr:ArgE/DapE family deacylase [Candidatus Aenigmarchaeota archaeon]MCK5289486.1 ArgE/DapE family deacylase [Candidatus Aenigmarchaeota archaeon]